MLKLCINQGYVPSDCKLDSMLVFLLVGDGKILVMVVMQIVYIELVNVKIIIQTKKK